ncbi:unnamed protein product [Wuchereria bancrofti]|uniref:carbonic anhydrase n=1 Tax=Wuchereria bancrofti TaxID=6293 RepID=A0A3P7GLR6_WUCBA|nr:unnamed protein product [Wuchereria bancrofti]
MYHNALFLTPITVFYVAAHKFGYDAEDGPSTWRGVCQTGKRQSPVDIRAFEIEIAPLDPLQFLNYDLTGHIHLANNGHTGAWKSGIIEPAVCPEIEETVAALLYCMAVLYVLVVGSGFERWGEKRPYISGGGLNGTYQLSQFHFHWSQQNDTGSEHTIASLHYPGELTSTPDIHLAMQTACIYLFQLHLVHIKKEPSPDEVNTIAVVAAFIKLDDHAGSLHNLKPYVHNIRMPNDTVKNQWYEGSLTTPGCDEVVVWTLMADPIAVTPSQMGAFHQVHFASGKTGHNWRPTQPLNGRKILFRPSITLRTFKSGGAMLKPVFQPFISIWLYGIYHIISVF